MRAWGRGVRPHGRVQAPRGPAGAPVHLSCDIKSQQTRRVPEAVPEKFLFSGDPGGRGSSEETVCGSGGFQNPDFFQGDSGPG